MEGVAERALNLRGLRQSPPLCIVGIDVNDAKYNSGI